MRRSTSGAAVRRPRRRTARSSSFTAEELLAEMDEAGVDAAILHPPGWDPNAGAVAIEAAKKYPDRFAILGNFPLDRPESRGLVEHWKDQPGMLGLRFTFHAPHQRTWPSDGTLDWLWAAAEKADVPIALQASRFLPTVGQIAERHPGLKLIVDHCGGLGGTAHNKGAGRLHPHAGPGGAGEVSERGAQGDRARRTTPATRTRSPASIPT